MKENKDRSCTRKIRYNSRKAAKKAAKSMKRVHGKRFVIYRCEFCFGYHVANEKRHR